MKLEEIHAMLARCLAHMPRHYPKPSLVLHETSQTMVDFLRRGRYAFHRGYDASDVLGMADALRNTIHLPLSTVRSEEPAVVLGTILHELGHLYAAQRHGAESPAYTDERRANAFERRWLRRLQGKVS
jgi:hypothetical protein